MASAWMGMNQLGSLVNGRGSVLAHPFRPKRKYLLKKDFLL